MQYFGIEFAEVTVALGLSEPSRGERVRCGESFGRADRGCGPRPVPAKYSFGYLVLLMQTCRWWRRQI